LRAEISDAGKYSLSTSCNGYAWNGKDFQPIGNKGEFIVAENKTMERGDEWLPYPRYLLRKQLVKKLLKREDLRGKKCLEGRHFGVIDQQQNYC
jgi:hypothetical protein